MNEHHTLSHLLTFAFLVGMVAVFAGLLLQPASGLYA